MIDRLFNFFAGLVAGLIHLPHADFIRLKIQARDA